MLAESKCYTRHCKYYKGVIQPDFTELTERNYCTVFPDGIPDDIAYGDNKHSAPLESQKNAIIYEKGKFEWED